MIPVKLKLRNFMCYKDGVPPLLLEGVHVACLCGENGAGKSTLLDAITWALWGETSRGKLDELIHLGRDEMEVELEFLSSGDLYRVVRKRERAGKRPGHTVLELQRGAGTGFIAISGSTARETQGKIDSLLRMKFDIFVNSAFLVQGRADEFTMKPPDQRKQVLAKILDLDFYDDLAKRAREAASARRVESLALDGQIEAMDRQLEKRDECQARLKQAESALQTQNESLAALEIQVQGLRLTKQALEQQQAQAAAVRQRVTQLQGEIARLLPRAEAARGEIARYELTLGDAESISADYAVLQETIARKDVLDTKSVACHRLSQQRTALEQTIERARHGLERERARLETRLQELRKASSGREETSANLEKAQKALQALAPLEEQTRDARASIQRIAELMSSLETANRTLRAEMDDIKERMDKLREGEGACPLCGTRLGEDRCEDVLAEYQAQGKQKGDAFRANSGRAAQLKQQREQLERDLALSEARLREQSAVLQPRIGLLEGRLEEADAAAAALPPVEQGLADIELRLQQQAYAPEEQKTLARTVLEMQELSYDQDSHAQVRAEVDRLRPQEARYRLLEDAERLLPQTKERLAELLEDIEGRESAMAQERSALETLSKEAAGLPGVAAGLARSEQAYKAAAAEAQRLHQDVGAARTHLERLDAMEAERAEKRRLRDRAAEGQSLYEELAGAFGRRGVQAMIIETAIPEIEEEANRLLARMTDNRMSVKLETQVPRKTTDSLQETLEIRVSDELGTRGYETFSGGEAFRVNVALRIALSRLLAKRAGAPLPTLFIDEGFGTQDAAGRDKLVETINSIQDQFERILVITHIDELKEQFPARIEVVKTPEGSTFSMS